MKCVRFSEEQIIGVLKEADDPVGTMFPLSNACEFAYERDKWTGGSRSAS